ncbi:MAG: hypothetical protein V8R94_06385 [Lachnospiraceae bacterium]
MVFYFLITAVTIALAGLMDAVWTRSGQEAGGVVAVRWTSRRECGIREWQARPRHPIIRRRLVSGGRFPTPRLRHRVSRCYFPDSGGRECAASGGR